MQAPASANGPDPQWLRHRFRSPGMHVPDAGVAGLSLAEGMRQCGCVCVCVCVCVCERLGIFVQPPYTAGRARSFSMTDAALPSQMTAVFMEMHFFSR